MHRAVLLAALVALVALGTASPAAGQARQPTLLAGVGQADITPPTGYAFGGWTRRDRVGRGVHTRLYAKAIVLQRGDQRVALVSLDLFAAPGGLVKEAADRNADLGFSERNVLVSASHTHAGPSGFANFQTLNTLAPSTETITDPSSFVEFFAPMPPDRQLYSFLAERLTHAIRQAALNLSAAQAGWGSAELTGVTRNRSLEAHLANHGIIEARGEGRPEQDPEGPVGTIDPAVDVLRVDRLVRRRRPCTRRGRRTTCLRLVAIPIGGWSTFANHATVNPAEYAFYNNDHHATAVRDFERRVREAGDVSPRRLVVNVYGNGAEGDMSAGLERRGPEHAEDVGRKEADAMFAAWRQAGRSMTRRPTLDLRWTRACFCGQMTSSGPVDDEPVPGIPFLTGSEEGRGPLFDVTRVPLEDRRSPVPDESQGHKIGVTGATSTDSVPKAVPLLTVQIRDRVIASLPGEPTAETGNRVRRAVLGAMRGSGVRRVVISGLANEFILYITTPEEFDRQHYEGGSSLYGRNAGTFLTEQLAALAGTLARGAPAPEPFPFDPRNGVTTGGPRFSQGATEGAFAAQPTGGRRAGQDVRFGWRGGPRGFDRPLGAAFITVERREGEMWQAVTDDLGLRIRWQVDDSGLYTGFWALPAGTQAGTYRVRITANRYRLASEVFSVVAG